MTTTGGRWQERLRMMLIGTIVAVVCLALMATEVHAAGKRKRPTAPPIAKVDTRPAAELAQMPPLPYSEEFERAELIERMLTECRGIAYNAYELAQTSGEALWLPAPIQLVVVRVRHPYCAELLRTYAPKTRV
jgi:hypothetical protein